MLDPVLAQRAGMTSALLSAWPQIVPAMLSETTRPHKINWPRRASEDDPFKPAVLIVAAEGMAALHLQHQTGEIIQRVNAFFGFQAVERLQIVQKAVAPDRPTPRRKAPVSKEDEARIARLAEGIEDEGLREALIRLGKSVRQEKR
ncbi:MAG: DciA family protein [Oricola sp.]